MMSLVSKKQSYLRMNKFIACCSLAYIVHVHVRVVWCISLVNLR